MKQNNLRDELNKLANSFFEIYNNEETKNGPTNEEGWLISAEDYRQKMLKIESVTPYKVRFLEIDGKIKWHIIEKT